MLPIWLRQGFGRHNFDLFRSLVLVGEALELLGDFREKSKPILFDEQRQEIVEDGWTPQVLAQACEDGVLFLEAEGRRGQDVVQGVILIDGGSESGKAFAGHIDLRRVEESKQGFGVTTSDSSLEHNQLPVTGGDLACRGARQNTAGYHSRLSRVKTEGQ